MTVWVLLDTSNVSGYSYIVAIWRTKAQAIKHANQLYNNKSIFEYSIEKWAIQD